MTIYYLDDGGSNTSPYDTWAKAATSLATLTALPLASGDIVYIGHDHVEPSPTSGSVTYTLPTDDPPVVFISATQGSNPPAYQASTTDQIKNAGSGTLTFDGAFAAYGVRFVSTGALTLAPDTTETAFLQSCTFAPAANGIVNFGGSNGRGLYARDCTIDLTADGTTGRANPPFSFPASGDTYVKRMSFINPGYRTGTITTCGSLSHRVEISSTDFSGFNNATDCEIFLGNSGGVVDFVGCKFKSSFTYLSSSTPQSGQRIQFFNCGSGSFDNPAAYALFCSSGSMVYDTVYRTGGAEIESLTGSYLVTTNPVCSESSPLFGPWIYGTTTNGTRTFDLYITNDTADFDDDEVWLEVEYLSTADEAIWALASDQRATITTTPAAQTDDTASTWNGAGPAYTYKQKLSCASVAVGETGQFRARVCVGLASIASSRYFYVDPKVTVT